MDKVHQIRALFFDHLFSNLELELTSTWLIIWMLGITFLLLILLSLFVGLNWERLMKILRGDPLPVDFDRIDGNDKDTPTLYQRMQEIIDRYRLQTKKLQDQLTELESQYQARMAALKMDSDRHAYYAYHDLLTDLPNRRLFEEQFAQGIRLAKRNLESFALLMIDLDNFKKVNDLHGHAVGDQVLQEVGRRLRNTLRESDLVARWGGDEFSIILFGTSDKTGVKAALEKLISAFETPIEVNGKQNWIRLSIGIGLYPFDGDDTVTLMRSADSALYRAKNDPELVYVFYDEMESIGAGGAGPWHSRIKEMGGYSLGPED